MKEVMKMKAIKKYVSSINDIYMTHSLFVSILMIIFATLLGLGIVFGFLCLRAWIIMLLWNWIAVSLFNAPVLNIWLALGLSLLCSMLFKSSSSGKENEEK
jgi:hypothetical protein